MPEQLIFTSKPTGIQPGRSGFQVVAQHSAINHRLVAALEKESIYEFADSSQALPVICKFQKFEFGDERYAVLTRMQSCGVDFTGRPNHIAHHLVFETKELPACPPAAIFALWKGWRQKWDTKPRFLGGWDRVNYENENEPFYFTKFALPAKTWKAQVGDEGAAAVPVLTESDHTLFPFPEGKEDLLVWLFLESQSLLPIEKAWDLTFTNHRIENDNLSRFRWIGYPKGSGSAGISLDADEMDVFEHQERIIIPQHELADKARISPVVSKPPPPKKRTSAISIAPVDELEPIQDELGLEEVEVTRPKLKMMVEKDELLESGLTSNLPDKHGDEVFGDIFTPDSNKKALKLPHGDLQDEEGMPVSEEKFLTRFRLPILLVMLILFVIGAVLMAPRMVELFNRKADPAPVVINTGPSEDELKQQKRMAIIEMDDDARFASQLGEVQQIIDKGQFLLARAYLSKYRGDAEKSRDADYVLLEAWFDTQKSTLESVNRETGLLAKQVAKREVIIDFDERVSELETSIEAMAGDLQPSLRRGLERIKTNYRTWLNNVRLKTANVPTFFIPISLDAPNPEITFTHMPEVVKDWLAGLDHFPITAQIENIRIEVSPFRGLNQFELSAEDAIDLSLWKHSERSLISYLDGQTEVIEIISDPNDLSKISFHWRFTGATSNKSVSTFPEPPIILNFLNTLTNQALNVVMMGGISQSVTTPAEVPFSFLKLETGSYRFNIMDPVLKEKLELFLLPPSRFLRLRSLDDQYLFAWDQTTQAFHLYESKDLESGKVKALQQEISQQHSNLQRLEREQTIYRSVNFVKNTPLWSLGTEVLPSGSCPASLENFGVYYQTEGKNYFEYLRAILSYFASEHTLIRPAVMEKWVAYPKDKIPQTKEAVVTYRNMLLRTSKRLRSLLKQDDPGNLEYWGNFVTNFEFWLLGEHQSQLEDVLSLSPEEIGIAQQTDITAVEQDLKVAREKIQELQSTLANSSDLTEIANINRWILEMTSMEGNHHTTPLILFK